MGKSEIVFEKNQRDARRLSRTAKKGDVLWVVEPISTEVAPYEDQFLLSKYTVTGQHPLLGGAMIGGHDVQQLVLGFGPVYLNWRPKGHRAMHEPSPQVAGPLESAGLEPHGRPLDDNELRQLEKLAADRRRPRKLSFF
ncbi:hypothetical protein ACXZ65_34380 [Streptomyces aculeolatus]